MPELPEAETIVRDLRSRVVGAAVAGVQVSRPDLLGPGVTAEILAVRLRGLVVSAVERRGKNVVIVFNDGARVVVNLGMTGRLVVSDSPRAGDLRHVGVRFELKDGRAILYDDARRFGRIDLREPEDWESWSGGLGIEPLSQQLTAERLLTLAGSSKMPIRNWLLDQRKLAGVGNIYANEALFRAKVKPARPAGSLRPREADRLAAALRDVLSEAILARGTTLNDYRDASGETGGYQFRLQVYGQEGEPCPVCGRTIRRVVLGGRSAFYCGRCQR